MLEFVEVDDWKTVEALRLLQASLLCASLQRVALTERTYSCNMNEARVFFKELATAVKRL
jgi:hypothetical protein